MQMKRRLFSLVFIGLIFLVACQEQSPAPTPSAGSNNATVEPAATAVPTIAPTETPEPVPTTTTPQEEPGPVTQESISEFPTAEIVNDEGGAVSITGEVEYTNTFFTMGVAEPVIILEDQAGFVDRNENFLMPVESQTLGQITSDFFTSPFSYSIALPLWWRLVDSLRLHFNQ
jgi:hypothetical protein